MTHSSSHLLLVHLTYRICRCPLVDHKLSVYHSSSLIRLAVLPYLTVTHRHWITKQCQVSMRINYTQMSAWRAVSLLTQHPLKRTRKISKLSYFNSSSSNTSIKCSKLLNRHWTCWTCIHSHNHIYIHCKHCYSQLNQSRLMIWCHFWRYSDMPINSCACIDARRVSSYLVNCLRSNTQLVGS